MINNTIYRRASAPGWKRGRQTVSLLRRFFSIPCPLLIIFFGCYYIERRLRWFQSNLLVDWYHPRSIWLSLRSLACTRRTSAKTKRWQKWWIELTMPVVGRFNYGQSSEIELDRRWIVFSFFRMMWMVLNLLVMHWWWSGRWEKKGGHHDKDDDSTLYYLVHNVLANASSFSWPDGDLWWHRSLRSASPRLA